MPSHDTRSGPTLAAEPTAPAQDLAEGRGRWVESRPVHPATKPAGPPTLPPKLGPVGPKALRATALTTTTRQQTAPLSLLSLERRLQDGAKNVRPMVELLPALRKTAVRWASDRIPPDVEPVVSLVSMKREELQGHLRTNEIFAQTSEEKLARLAALGEVMKFEKGARILEEGDPSEHLFVLIKGVVGVFYSSPDGVDVLVKIFGAPAVFGEMELIFGQPRQEYVECFEECVAARLPGNEFMSFMRADPTACYVMLKDVSSRLAIAAYNERALAFLDAATRLAGLFLTFIEAYGEETDEGITLKLKLTYEMLARCLGVTVRSIDRTMTDWTKEGWVSRSRGLYTFHSLEKLAERADPERLALFSKLGLLPHISGRLPAAER